MTTAFNLQAWSKTASSNSGVDAGIGLLTNTSYPNTVDNWWRGDMAAVARWADDTGGALLAAGTANALTVYTNQSLDSGHLADGLTLVVKAAFTNTSSSVTFSPDGHTARAVKAADGSGLSAGQIKAGARLVLVYRAAGTPVWHCVNLQASASGFGAAACSFMAHKNEFDQGLVTGTPVLVTFGIAEFNVGSALASSVWTPPEGTALIMLQATIGVATTDVPVTVSLYKNGAVHRTMQLIPDRLNILSAYAEAWGTLTTIEQVNGSDSFSVYATRTTSADAYVAGKVNKTWWAGTMV